MKGLRDIIIEAVEDFYIYDPCWHPDEWKVEVADAIIEAMIQDAAENWKNHPDNKEWPE